MRLFGTDGVRGPFGEPPLNRDTVIRLAATLALKLGRELGRQPLAVVAGDTRASTDQLAAWIASGFAASGGTLRYAGVLPTPGVAYLTRQLEADVGIAISASHNPYPDNGVKLFDADGIKWTRSREDELESELLQPAELDAVVVEEPPAVEAELDAAYLEYLLGTVPQGEPLAGLRLAVDCAHGAAAPYAERLFTRLGARVVVTGDRPDGRNINQDCGSTRPQRLAALVRQSDFQLGVAFDGDADRALLIDEKGAPQDGDTMLFLWANDLARRQLLDPAAIVATTMSNLGLELALEREGIDMLRCDVGDRIVAETMRQHGVLLGGEQSGHLIHLGLGSTGDGLLTALQLAHLIVRSGESLATLAAPLERMPQVLVNVRVAERMPFAELPRIREMTQEIDRRLGDAGRLLLRYSGTEPLARVMIEGRDQGEIEAMAHDLADEIGRQLGGDS